jgi:hypothetical protein
MPVAICGFDDPHTGICTRPPVDPPNGAGDLCVADEDLPAAVREIFTMYCDEHRNEQTPDAAVEAYVQITLRDRAWIRAYLESDDGLRDLLLQLSPSARDTLRTVLIRDNRDEIAELLRYGDARAARCRVPVP